jgi:hypothetical protein
MLGDTMFAKIYESHTTPCPRDVRKLDFLQETITIRARYKRHQMRWQTQLDVSKAVIRVAMRGSR